MDSKTTTFKDLKIGSLFYCKGNCSPHTYLVKLNKNQYAEFADPIVVWT